MFGSGYVIEHCVTALKKRRRQEAYQVYVTDCLRLSAMGLIAGSVTRFFDIINPKPQDDRTSKEIIDDIISRAGLKVVNRE